MADGREVMGAGNGASQCHMGPSDAVGYSVEINAKPALMVASDCRWRQPPVKVVLLEDEVHLWFASLDPPASSLRRLEQTLDASERSRAKRFYFERERVRFVAGRGLLRRILGYYSGIEPSELQFCYSSQGKPSLTEKCGGDRIQFNLAHSAGRAIYAVTLNREIGVDLERVAPVIGLEQVANRFFSAHERAALHALAGREEREAFFEIWTAKEAYFHYWPLRGFSTAGLILVLLGLAAGFRPLARYLSTGHVSPYIPSSIVASLLLTLGFLMFVVAFLADMTRSNRELVEELLFREKYQSGK